VKVAVSTESGGGLTSRIDPRFGRARYFVIVDDESDHVQVIDNQAALESAHGAGIAAAHRVADAGAQAVITGNVGPKAFEALSTAGVNVYLTHVGTVEVVVKRLMSGRLERTTRASPTGHMNQR
jgi:predicted Fe-Mo cluster-binding NifX family protein